MCERGGVFKKLIIVVVLLAIVGAGAAFYLLSRINSIVAKRIEEDGSLITGTKVTVNSVDITLAEGKGVFKELSVANPEGFSQGNAFILGEIILDIDIQSITKEPVIIEEVTVNAPRVAFEVTTAIDLASLTNVSNATNKILNSSNLFRLKSNIEKAVGSSGEDTGPERKIRIKKFVFRSGQAAISVPSLGIKDMSIDIPAINLTDVGGSSGAPPKEIGTQIAIAFSKEVTKVVERAFMTIVKSKLADQIKNKLQDEVGDKLDGKLGTGAKKLLNGLFK